MDIFSAFVHNGLPQQQIESKMLFQIIMGSNITTTGLKATILYLITALCIIEKLWAEIDAMEIAGIISNPIQNAKAKGFLFL